MIEARGLTKYYADYPAIQDISFHAEPGEIVGFLGPNGAGKTTTMRILTGYMPPSDGVAIVAGYDVFRQSREARQRIGYLPETVPLYTEMTVWDYLDYMARLRAVRNRDQREEQIEEALDLCNLTDRADSVIGRLSKGYRQRVGLAQALVHKPEVLILDEPTIGLDPRQVREVREVIRGLGRERTVLLSTHILSEASQICNRIVVINKGRIVAEDMLEHLTSNQGDTRRILLRVERDGAGLTEALQALRHVTAVRPLPDGTVEIKTSRDGDPRAAIADAVVQGGYRLLEMRTADTSLEEIFLHLTLEPEVTEAEMLAEEEEEIEVEEVEIEEDEESA
jgi:ABC-2 type transport system ATP-binding protein